MEEKQWIKRRKRWRQHAREKSELTGKIINLKWRVSADSLWSRVVKREAPGQLCEVTGCTRLGSHAHHIIGRQNLLTRYEIKNGIRLCNLHHTDSPDFSAHKTSQDFMAWLEQAKPEQFQWVMEHKFKLTFEQVDYKLCYDKLLKEFYDG